MNYTRIWVDLKVNVLEDKFVKKSNAKINFENVIL